VWQGSNAAFTATTTSPGNSWTAGTVALENNAIDGTFRNVGQTTFSVTDIKPGDSDEACITVRSQGTVPGNGRFFVSNVTGTPGPGLGDLTTQIDLTVEAGTGSAVDCSDFTSASTVLSSVPLSSAPASYAAAANSWALAGTAGETRTYRVSYTFDSAAGNAYQGSSAGATFNWEVQ
jgi:hypothetical protein